MPPLLKWSINFVVYRISKLAEGNETKKKKKGWNAGGNAD